MKYWEVIADKLSAAGWSWGCCSAVTKYGWRRIVDAHGRGRRYIASDDLLVAILKPSSRWPSSVGRTDIKEQEDEILRDRR